MTRSTAWLTLRVLAAVASGLTGPGTSRAELLSGDPSADGWAAGANSLQAGTYVRGGGNFSYDLFRVSYAVTPGSPLASMPNPWSVGDRVVGMGGVAVPTTASAAGWAGFTGGPVNGHLAANVRIVSKFTSSPSAWSASGVAPSLGDGAGSYSNGDGGLGAVLVSTASGQVTPAGAGVLTVPLNANQWAGTAGSNGPAIDPLTSRVIYAVDASGRLRSWELLLDTTLLAGADTGRPTPGPAGRWNQALQAGQSSVFLTDALSPGESVVPAPGPAVLLGVGLAALGLGHRLRAKLYTLPGSD